MTTTDPRALELAKTRLRLAHEARGSRPNWDNLTPGDQTFLQQEAAEWLHAAVQAGIAPPVERPTEDHEAVYVDEQGLLYGEYRVSSLTEQTHLLRLVWIDDVAVPKARLEEEGATLRLLGWSL
ncbi:MAG: hypothetical protein HOV70_20225 [Streptomyces sp.]|nr:hypothetical protein [Streptomyces sp.]